MMDSKANPTAQQSLRQEERIQDPGKHVSRTTRTQHESHFISTQQFKHVSGSIRTQHSSSSMFSSDSSKSQNMFQSIRTQQSPSSKHVSGSIRTQHFSSSMFSSEYDSSKSQSIFQSIRTQQSLSSKHVSGSIRTQHSPSSVLSSEYDSSKSQSMFQSIRTQQFPSSKHVSGSIRTQHSSSSEYDSSKSQSMFQSIRTQQSPSSKHVSGSIRTQHSSSSVFSSEYDSSKSQSMFQSIRTQQSPSSKHVSGSIRTQYSSPSIFSSKYNPSKPQEDTGIEKKKIELPSGFHEHPLKLTPAGALYRCRGCKEQGCGPSYRCENSDCSYVLHQECANAVLHRDKNPVSHSFFEGEIFKFKDEPGGSRVCDACRMEVKGFVYHREAARDVNDTGLDLHPCCLKLRYSISYEESGAIKTLTLQPNVRGKCAQCNSRKVKGDINVKGWSYSTSDGDCYHISCFKKLFLEILEEEGFSEEKVVVSKMQANNNNIGNNMKVVKAGGSSKSMGSVIMKVVTKLGPMVIKLVLSLLIGHPLPFLPDVVGLLTS